ncbi:MAG: GlxA family transcriptional regulator [Phenylobacterium sp.]|uniref:GlxA family transcriptional regulator n=1 Tax=Phenylobacterium sp. TaxID=1871053 RepID=UPI00391DC444
MTVVEVLVLRGASPSSVAITVELLQTANQIRIASGRLPPFSVRLTGSGAKAAQSYFGVGAAASVEKADVLVVPGLALTNEEAVIEGLSRKDAVAARRRLMEAFTQGAEIASSCSAVFLVAAAGVLDGRRATTSWWLSPLFRRLYPAVSLDTDAMVVTDGRVTTAGAAMAQMDLMLSVIARHSDVSLAERCARYMLLEERKSQARYMAIGFLSGADEQISRAERWARKRLEENFPIGALAEAAGLTARTFARRLERTTGLSPVRFLQRLRVERAVELLETTRLPFDEIARRVGYAEPSTLRRLLRREGGLGAREIRSLV